MLYRSLLRPVLFSLPAETAHELALKSLASAPEFVTSSFANRYQRSPFGKLSRFGLTFDNPVGLAAGFDKDGIALELSRRWVLVLSKQALSLITRSREIRSRDCFVSQLDRCAYQSRGLQQ